VLVQQPSLGLKGTLQDTQHVHSTSSKPSHRISRPRELWQQQQELQEQEQAAALLVVAVLPTASACVAVAQDLLLPLVLLCLAEVAGHHLLLQ
jgi:hypothetical protein